MHSLVQKCQNRFQAPEQNADIIDSERLPSNSNSKPKCTYAQENSKGELHSLFAAKEPSNSGKFRKIEIDERADMTAKPQSFLRTTVGVGMIVGRPILEEAHYELSDPILDGDGELDYLSPSNSKHIANQHIATSNDEINHLYHTRVTEVL